MSSSSEKAPSLEEKGATNSPDVAAVAALSTYGDDKLASDGLNLDEKRHQLEERLAELEQHGGINEKRMIRKIDYRVVPIMSLLYLLSFLDRTNIGNAKLFGLTTDLSLQGLQYNNALAVYFIFYAAFEVPSNMIMRRWRPSRWLPILMIIWGATMIGMGFVQNYAALVGTRILLGASEAGIYPGVTYFMTCWYRKREVAFRMGFFFSMATLAGAFGGLLARLIELMDGKGDLAGWRWIFILEGILTVVVAFASFWLLYDYPDTAQFLSDDERAWVQTRMELDDEGLSGTGFDWKYVRAAFLDWRVWLYAGNYWVRDVRGRKLTVQGTLMAVYGYSQFSPTIIAALGYSNANAQLLSVPPYVLACITTIGVGYYSDKFQVRAPFVLGFIGIGILGFVLVIATPHAGVAYAGMHIAAAGIYPQISLIVAWIANNVPNSTKRATAMPIVVMTGIFGGFDSPRYYLGHGFMIAGLTFSFVCGVLLVVYILRTNAKKRAALEARGRPYSAEEKTQYANAGEDAPWFIHSL